MSDATKVLLVHLGAAILLLILHGINQFTVLTDKITESFDYSHAEIECLLQQDEQERKVMLNNIQERKNKGQ